MEEATARKLRYWEDLDNGSWVIKEREGSLYETWLPNYVKNQATLVGGGGESRTSPWLCRMRILNSKKKTLVNRTGIPYVYITPFHPIFAPSPK